MLRTIKRGADFLLAWEEEQGVVSMDDWTEDVMKVFDIDDSRIYDGDWRRGCPLSSDKRSNPLSDAKASGGRVIFSHTGSSETYPSLRPPLYVSCRSTRVPCQIGREKLLSHLGVLFCPYWIKHGRFP